VFFCTYKALSSTTRRSLKPPSEGTVTGSFSRGVNVGNLVQPNSPEASHCLLFHFTVVASHGLPGKNLSTCNNGPPLQRASRATQTAKRWDERNDVFPFCLFRSPPTIIVSPFLMEKMDVSLHGSCCCSEAFSQKPAPQTKVTWGNPPVALAIL